MKLLVLSIDGRGMGHLNRTTILAQALEEAEPGAKVRFFAESPACAMVEQQGFGVWKLPDPMHRLGRYFIRGRRAQLEAELMAPMVNSWRPDAVMLDFVLDGDLFGMIRAAGCKVLLVLRRLVPRAMAGLAKDPASDLVHGFLVPGEREDFSPGEIPSSIMSRCVFTGPLVRKIQLGRVGELRKKYAGSAKRLVLVTLGGGGWEGAGELAEQAWDALLRLQRDRPGFRGVMVCGPLFEGRTFETIGGVKSVRFEGMLAELMVACDAVVCSAGYNSTRELEASGTPGVLLPLPDPGRDDQEARARRAVDKGFALMARVDASEIHRAVSSILDGRGPSRRKPMVADLSRCGKLLSSIISS